MSPTLAYQFNRFLRGSVPFAVTVLLALMSVVPIGIAGYAIVTPSFAAISVFYWSIHRPYLMAPPLCFLLGLLSDCLTGAPLGLSSFLYLLIHGITVSQRRIFIGKSFVLTWFGFALIGFIIAMLSWLIACLYSLALLPLTPILVQFALSLLVFPMFAWGFGMLQNSLLRTT
ncbi:rod shape-determining protein MreD [Sneathiella chungangensis]|uniref:Rod shape-determining protein MreD n=1 Tax=Sneathiella chungangensis TaxID=1418234 RepID=A0A845ME94_9PROT|nr:rod shape-determining protein MreD [Sneathiella chungangensis]